MLRILKNQRTRTSPRYNDMSHVVENSTVQYLDVEFLDSWRGNVQRCFQLGDQRLKITQFNSEKLELQFDVFVRSALQDLQPGGQVSELAQKNHQLTFDTGDLKA